MSAPPRPGGTVRAVLTPDPRPTSFENHPGLRGREPEARELADVLRRLIRLSVSTAPSPPETARLTAQLAAVADELESHLPEVPLPRFIAPDEDGPPKDVPLGGAMPYDVVVGPFNPVALPVVLDFEPPKALGRAVFDVAYEGAPGCVHGAMLAAAFDIILTAANAIEGAVGPTVRLAVRYLRPTLTDEEAVFEGWVTEVTDRRIFSKGRIVQGGHRHGRGRGRVRHLQPGRREADGVEPSSFVRRGPPPAGRGSTSAGLRRRRPTAATSSRRGSSGRIVARQSLQPSRDPADYAFVHRLRTRFAETDAMGSSTTRRTCRTWRRRGWSTSGRSAIPTTRCGPGTPPATGRRAAGGTSPCSRCPCSTARPLRFDDQVDVCAGGRRRDPHHLPDRLSAVGRRRGAGDRRDGARVRRRSRPPGTDAGVGARGVRGVRELRARTRAARRTPPEAAEPGRLAPGSGAHDITIWLCQRRRQS